MMSVVEGSAILIGYHLLYRPRKGQLCTKISQLTLCGSLLSSPLFSLFLFSIYFPDTVSAVQGKVNYAPRYRNLPTETACFPSRFLSLPPLLLSQRFEPFPDAIDPRIQGASLQHIGHVSTTLLPKPSDHLPRFPYRPHSTAAVHGRKGQV